jgi:3-hydroxymyristoyl/3-hydroxydecanoyl-(acyl carrier protein) dehydratase
VCSGAILLAERQREFVPPALRGRVRRSATNSTNFKLETMTMRESIHRAQIGDPQTSADGSTTLEFCFAPDDPTFAGHFPTRPLLPGVFQLEMARIATEAMLNRPLTVREVTKAKFLRPIIPAEIVRVELKLVEKADTIQARARFSVTGQSAGEAILQLARNP